MLDAGCLIPGFIYNWQRGYIMKKTFISNPLCLSIMIIVLIWVQKLIRNIFYIDMTLDLYKSITQFFLFAFILGIMYVIVVTVLLRFSGETYRDIGFNNNKLPAQIKFGVLFGLSIFILDTFMVSPIIEGLLPKTAMEGIDKSRLFSNIYFLPILILLTSFKGGFAEELWRIFVLTRFEKCWGRTGLVFAIAAGSLVFGVGHLYQGVGGMITVAIVGFLYALVYLRKRLALEVVIAHATYDIVAVVLGFIIYYGQ